MKKKKDLKGISLIDAYGNIGFAKSRFVSIVEIIDSGMKSEIAVEAINGIALAAICFLNHASDSLESVDKSLLKDGQEEGEEAQP